MNIRFRSSIRSGALRQPIGPNPPLIYARVFPELTGDLERVDPGPLPPASLVAGVMHRAVMDAAERDREFIARLAAERPWLDVAKMRDPMVCGRSPPAMDHPRLI